MSEQIAIRVNQRCPYATFRLVTSSSYYYKYALQKRYLWLGLVPCWETIGQTDDPEEVERLIADYLERQKVETSIPRYYAAPLDGFRWPP